MSLRRDACLGAAVAMRRAMVEVPELAGAEQMLDAVERLRCHVDSFATVITVELEGIKAQLDVMITELRKPAAMPKFIGE